MGIYWNFFLKLTTIHLILFFVAYYRLLNIFLLLLLFFRSINVFGKDYQGALLDDRLLKSKILARLLSTLYFIVFIIWYCYHCNFATSIVTLNGLFVAFFQLVQLSLKQTFYETPTNETPKQFGGVKEEAFIR